MKVDALDFEESCKGAAQVVRAQLRNADHGAAVGDELCDALRPDADAPARRTFVEGEIDADLESGWVSEPLRLEAMHLEDHLAETRRHLDRGHTLVRAEENQGASLQIDISPIDPGDFEEAKTSEHTPGDGERVALAEQLVAVGQARLEQRVDLFVA